MQVKPDNRNETCFVPTERGRKLIPIPAIIALRSIDVYKRQVVYVSGKERKTHLVIAKHQNNKIVYVDPQTGDRVNIDRRLNLTVKGMTEISRIDNLKPSKYINGCVRRRKDDKQKKRPKQFEKVKEKELTGSGVPMLRRNT